MKKKLPVVHRHFSLIVDVFYTVIYMKEKKIYVSKRNVILLFIRMKINRSVLNLYNHNR
jgi:hypothetical protein